MRNNRVFRSISGLTIASRITILYGGIFSISLLLISFFIIGNAAMINQSITKQELVKTMENIDIFLKQGNELTEENLTNLLANKYVEVQVICLSTSDVFNSSIGKLPPFLQNVFPKDLERTIPNRDKPDTDNEKEKFNPRNADYTIQSDHGKEFMVIKHRAVYDDKIYMIEAFKMITENFYYIKSFGIRLIILDIFGIFIAILIGKYISRLILKPVGNIRQAAERISIEDLTQRIDVTGPNDEMQELTITFNSMIERLQSSFVKQNQFISDASHELRTPISVIQGYANLVNRWGKSDPVVLQESIDSIIAETEHMSVLIKKLLFLAKSDQNRNHVQKSNVILNDIVKEVVKELNVMEVEREIIYEEKEEILIYADSSLVKQLLWIHAENSLKYTKTNERILFSVFREDKYGCVSVSDSGAGMKEEDIPFIFDRFYRADKSRNKDIPGTGLGLSIAQWIIENHCGKIFVKSELGKGSTFTDMFKISDEYVKEEENEKTVSNNDDNSSDD